MTIEALNAAKVLSEKIALAERRLDEWKGFDGFADEKIEGAAMFYIAAPNSDNVLKEYNLRYWERELERLQREFDAL